MNSIIKGLAVGTMLLVAVPAFAASITEARFSNNDTTIDAQGNSTVSGTFKLTVNPGEVVEQLRAITNGLSTDASVGGSLGYQEGVYANVPFSVKVSPNTGTFNVDLQTDGIFGANHAISPVDTAAGAVISGPITVGTVRVVASNTTTSTGSETTAPNGVPQSVWDKFLAWMLGSATTPTPTPTPAPTKPCPPSVNAVGTLSLQTWLVDHGYMSASAKATGPGIYGPKTMAAENAALLACH